MSDHDGQRPTMSATRSDQHTMTTSEVVKLFEEATLPREKRSIERYCEQGKLDCFKDPDEMRYYITRASADKLIGHLKELKQRHEQPLMQAPQPSAPTARDTPQRSATTAQDEDGVKRGPPEKQDEKHPGGEDRERVATLEARIKELENKNFNLEIDKRAKEEVLGLMREQMTHQITAFSTEISKQSNRVGQLETQMRQLHAPRRDSFPTPDDADTVDEGDAIDAEYRDTDVPTHTPHNDVSPHTHQP